MAQGLDEWVVVPVGIGQGPDVIGGDGASDFGDELDRFGPVGLGAPVGRSEQPGEGDDLRVAGGPDGGVGAIDVPAGAVKDCHDPVEVVGVRMLPRRPRGSEADATDEEPEQRRKRA